MNDVARIVKQRVNEETLPTGTDLDKELDKFEFENSSDAFNLIYNILSHIKRVGFENFVREYYKHIQTQNNSTKPLTYCFVLNTNTNETYKIDLYYNVYCYIIFSIISNTNIDYIDEDILFYPQDRNYIQTYKKFYRMYIINDKYNKNEKLFLDIVDTIGNKFSMSYITNMFP